jgi:hypothetical protein
MKVEARWLWQGYFDLSRQDPRATTTIGVRNQLCTSLGLPRRPVTQTHLLVAGRGPRLRRGSVLRSNFSRAPGTVPWCLGGKGIGGPRCHPRRQARIVLHGSEGLGLASPVETRAHVVRERHPRLRERGRATDLRPNNIPPTRRGRRNRSRAANLCVQRWSLV